MYAKTRICIYWLIFTGLIVLLTGCEPYQSIIYDNQTSFTVKVDISLVPVDYSGTPTLTWDSPGVVLSEKETKEFMTSVPNTKRGGADYKYTVVAVIETGEIVFSKVFTWDELHDMNWRVVLK
jgi:hypothetical protein